MSAIQRIRVGAGTSASPITRTSGASASPFTPSQNPNFQPQRMTNKTTPAAPSQVPKPPKPPERPLMPYMRYSKSVWDQARAAHPELKLWELGKVIGSMWRELSDDKKQEFQEQYEQDKVEYEKVMKAYHNSPAYQAFLVEKNKAKKAEEQASMPAPVERAPPPTYHARVQSAPMERRIDIQPAEDDDDQDEGFSVKHVSHSRYLRNHRLMSDIFSEALVPDVRSVVTNSRMQVLKKQVQSLTMHQKKLEDELGQIEGKFEAKKRKFTEASDEFNSELKRLCSQVLDQEAFQKACDDQYEQLKKKAEEEKKNEAEKKKMDEEAKANAPPLSTVTEVQSDSGAKPMETDQTGETVATPTTAEQATPENTSTWSSEAGAGFAEQQPQAATPVADNTVPHEGGTMHPLEPRGTVVAERPIATPVSEPYQVDQKPVTQEIGQPVEENAPAEVGVEVSTEIEQDQEMAPAEPASEDTDKEIKEDEAPKEEFEGSAVGADVSEEQKTVAKVEDEVENVAEGDIEDTPAEQAAVEEPEEVKTESAE